MPTDQKKNSLRYQKSQRLRSSADFRPCFKGVRAGDDHLLLFVRLSSTDNTRIGVSVSKKHGNAVARNRKKRLLREAFRLIQLELPTGLDVVLVPRQHRRSKLEDYKTSLIRLTRKLARRLNDSQKSAAQQKG